MTKSGNNNLDTGSIDTAHSGFSIPIIPLELAHQIHPLIKSSRVFDRLSSLFRDLALRSPPISEQNRWHDHVINACTYRFAQPLTLTPYASARACSARCRFCSENLRNNLGSDRPAASLRPGPNYFADLRRALAALKGVPLLYSLSGLESTDDPQWLLNLLETLRTTTEGPRVGGAVLYSNGAGLVTHGAELIPALLSSGVSWIEWSRHHDQEESHQNIMRFRDGQKVSRQRDFTNAVHVVSQQIPVKMVCVIQRRGIETANDIERYVLWARSLGACSVIFREFSALPPHYQNNATHRYIDDARVTIDDLILECLDSPHFSISYEPISLTGGYYFWNARWRLRDGFEIVFEKSDYGLMLERESSGLIYKLVFHANGNLCSGWQPDHNVLWSAYGGQ